MLLDYKISLKHILSLYMCISQSFIIFFDCNEKNKTRNPIYTSYKLSDQVLTSL